MAINPKKNFLLLSMLTIVSLSTLAQQPDAKTLQETARTFTRQGDYANAIMVLTGASQKDPQNIELQKDLAFNYYLEHEYAKGLNIARPLTERADADVQCYQMTGLFLKAIDDPKECEKLYKSGIKRFPRSGVLYNEYGEMLWARQDNAAIRQWEKGIEVDPNYSSNYYNASRYYFYATSDRVWSILYAETFLNLESYSKRTAEIKDILLQAYIKFYTPVVDGEKDQTSKSAFTAAFQEQMNKLTSDISQGVTTESLIVLRTRFIIGWFNTYPTNFPYRLFDYQRQLLKDGMFDAYNQWIFGAAENLSVFQTWSNTHSEDYNRFINYQKGRIFKLPEGQYYQAAK